MSSRDIIAWYREFYPVYNRQRLILDFRHNNGGNIDSIVLEKLLRKAWFYWKDRVGEPYPEHAVRLPRPPGGARATRTRLRTARPSIEGFRRLGLGKVIGMRTWGGEIWLSSTNRPDRRRARPSADDRRLRPDGEWLIEGHGVEPDIVVDNLPHATFNGDDAQLDAAIEYLLERDPQGPARRARAPPYPDKSFDYPGE